MDMMKVTSAIREVIIENYSRTSNFNEYVIKKLCKGHPEHPQLTHLKLLGVPNESFFLKSVIIGVPNLSESKTSDHQTWRSAR